MVGQPPQAKPYKVHKFFSLISLIGPLPVAPACCIEARKASGLEDADETLPLRLRDSPDGGTHSAKHCGQRSWHTPNLIVLRVILHYIIVAQYASIFTFALLVMPSAS